jgi:hypothetical protein
VNRRFGQPALDGVHAPHVSIAAFDMVGWDDAIKMPSEVLFSLDELDDLGLSSSNSQLRELLTVKFTCVKLRLGKTAETIR